MTEKTMKRTGGSGIRWRLVAWVGLVFLLLLPLLAMQLTDQVAWDLADFAVFGALLAGSGVIFELVVRQTSTISYRAAVGVALAGAFLLVWVNLAVGIVGRADNSVNLMFGGVLAVGIIGGLAARFRPGGMARTMLAMAIVQLLVAVIVLSTVQGAAGPKWPTGLLGLTGFFTALWLVAAWYFRKAARLMSASGSAV